MEELILPHDHNEQDLERMTEGLARGGDFEAAAEVFRHLGDATRIKIFWLLCHYEECVINIAAMVGMSSPAVSHHLRQLKSSGLITSRRDGKEVYYKAADSLKTRLLHEAIEEMLQITCPGGD